MIEEKKELFSQTVRAGLRTYFFDIKQSKEKTPYLVISESKAVGADYKHHRVIVFEEDFEAFLAGIENTIAFIRKSQKLKTYSVKTLRQKYPNAYTRWSFEDDELLISKYDQGKSVTELSQFFQRQPGAIRSRLVKLGKKSD